MIHIIILRHNTDPSTVFPTVCFMLTHFDFQCTTSFFLLAVWYFQVSIFRFSLHIYLGFQNHCNLDLFPYSNNSEHFLLNRGSCCLTISQSSLSLTILIFSPVQVTLWLAILCSATIHSTDSFKNRRPKIPKKLQKFFKIHNYKYLI